MPEISEQDFQQLKDQVAGLSSQLASARNRIDELENFATDHLGLDWGASLVDANSPHPNISVDTIESGGGIIRQDIHGMQILTSGTSPYGTIYWPGYTPSSDPATVYPRAELAGISNGVAIALLRLAAYRNSTNYADVSAFTGIATNPQAWLNTTTPNYNAGVYALAYEAGGGAAQVEWRGSLWQGKTNLAQITSDQNDYDVGAKQRSVIGLSSDAARNITGILATSVNNGAFLFLHNRGSFAITLKDESASSSAANRFALVSDITLPPDGCCILQYDSVATRWRALASPSSTPTTLLLTDTAWAAKGDLAVGTANDTAQILSKGTDGTRLVADATGIATYGIGWKAFWYIVASCTGSGTTALSSYHKYVRFASMTGNCTATLYSAAAIGEGDCVLFKRNDTTGFNATINTTSSQTIDGALSITLAPYESALLVSNGSNWERN